MSVKIGELMADKLRGRVKKKKSIPKKDITSTISDFVKRGEEPQQGAISTKWAVFFIFGIFVLALLLRTYFILDPATEDGYKLTGGSDPYYHKRVVDYIQDEKKHLMNDNLLNYPLGSKNPRPPAFDWSLAVGGMVLSPFFDGDVAESTWWVIEFMPALWGALIVFPLYFLTKEQFGAKAGLIVAFLIATMAGAVGHSTFSLADHDSFVLFFVAVTFFFYVKALRSFGTEKWVKDWMDLKNVRLGLNNFLTHNKVALGYSALAGMAVGTISISWKGYAYVLTIIAVYATVQIFIDHFRGTDALGVALCSLLVIAIPLVISFPYYAFSLEQAGGWWTPAFYIFFGLIIVSVILVPTRDIPWIIVIPSIVVFIISGSLILEFLFGGETAAIFGGMGYFYRTKLYETIAEAQPPEFSRAVFSYGIVTIYLAIVGLVLMAIRFPKHWKRDHLFIIIWGVVAIYMSLSAVRFMYNATPIFAILAGAFLWEIITWIDYKGMMRTIHGLRGDRLHAIKKGVGIKHIVGALFIAFLIVFPNTYFAVDAAIPFEDKKNRDVDFYELLPSFLRPEEYNYTERNNKTLYPNGVDGYYNKTQGGNKYLGAFGPSFPSEFWLDGFDWLLEEDTHLAPEDRPAFISWWDYGFWCVQLADHPTVADNFQQGYQIAGTLLTAQSEKETIALFAFRLLQGDIRGGFSEGVVKSMEKYLSKEQRDDIIDLLKNPRNYDIKGDDISWQNTQLRSVRDVLVELPYDDLLWFLHDIEKSTGNTIRYFAGDHRLFPFSAQNTGIFYAPVRLSDQDINDFLQTLYVTDTGDRLTKEEVEERARDNPDFQVTDFELKYTEEFFNTMFFKCFIGWSGRDVDQEEGGIPGVSGDLAQYRPMPGWMMKNFKLVYLNDGVRFLKFYEGALINGTVKTEGGTPVQNAHVTVMGKDYTPYGDYWVPHDKVVTDVNGNYNLLAPFGEVKVIASYGNISSYSKLSNVAEIQLNETYFNITDDQAMRKRDFVINRDLNVKSSALSGTIFWDKDDNDNFDANSDTPIKGLDVEIITKENTTKVVTTDENGKYTFDELSPGEYNLSFIINGKKIAIKSFEDTEAIKPDATLTENFGITPAKIYGTILHQNGSAFKNANISLTDEDGNIFSVISNNEGYYELGKLLYGFYTIKSENEGYVINLSKQDLEINLNEYDDIQRDFTLKKSAIINGDVVINFKGQNVKIEFKGRDEAIIYPVYTSSKGKYEVELPIGTYEVAISNHTLNEKNYVFLDKIDITKSQKYDINLVEGVEVTGIAYIDKNGNENIDENEDKIRTFIKFRSSKGELITNSNNLGNFEIYLPPDIYSISSKFTNETENKTYSNLKKLNVRENKQRTSHIGLTESVKIEGILYQGNEGIDEINITENKVSGTIIFKSSEGNIEVTTNGNYAVYLPNDEYEIITKSNGFIDYYKKMVLEENTVLDIKILPQKVKIYGKTYEDKAIKNVELTISDLSKNANDMTVFSDENGYYEVELVPGNYDIRAEQNSEKGVKFYKNIGIGLNIGDSSRLLDIKMTKSVRVYGKTFFDNNTNGIMDKGENIDILEFDFIGENTDLVISKDNEYEIFLIPGEYSIYSNFTTDNITYVYLNTIDLSEEKKFDIKPEKNTSLEGTIFYYNDNNEINQVVTITFKSDNGEINTTTDEIGNYNIQIPSGSYTLTIDEAGFDYYEKVVEVKASEENNYDAVLNLKKIKLTGNVLYEDIHGEKKNFKVKIKFNGNSDAAIDEIVTTNKTGFYEVDLNPTRNEQDYDVVIDHYEIGNTILYTNRFPRAPDENPEPLKGFDHTRETVKIEIGEEQMIKNISIFKKYRMRGITYFDRNDNQEIDDGEAVENTEIEIRDAVGFVYDKTIKSGANGEYEFYIDEGDYTVYAHSTNGMTTAYIGNISVKKAMIYNIPLIRGVRLNGTIYSGEIDNKIEPPEIILEHPASLGVFKIIPKGSEFETILPIGTVEMHINSQISVTDGPDKNYHYDTNLTLNSNDDPLIYNINMEEVEPFGVDIQLKDNTSSVFINGEVIYEITIINTGNQSENIALSSEPTMDNWTIGFSTQSVELEPKASKIVEVTITSNENASNGESVEFKIIATSSEESDVSDSINITTIAKDRPFPDLKVTSFEFEEKPKDGENVTIIAYVENLAVNSNITECDIVLLINDVPIETLRVTLTPGEKKAVKFLWKAKSGTHKMDIWVDNNNEVNESEDDNNILTEVIRVDEKPRNWNKLFGFIIFLIVVFIILLYLKKRK